MQSKVLKKTKETRKRTNGLSALIISELRLDGHPKRSFTCLILLLLPVALIFPAASLHAQTVERAPNTVSSSKSSSETSENPKADSNNSNNSNKLNDQKVSGKSKVSVEKIAVGKITVEETAVEQISRFTFDSLLKRRAAKLDDKARRFYEQELKARPEMKGVKFLADDDPRAVSFARNINPILRLFDRENYSKAIIFESTNPFVGLYRECIIIFSTKALDLLTPEQQRAAAAHELAHEVFIGEMRAADSANDNKQRHLIELECDLVAVLATSRFGDDPFDVVWADEAFADWYRTNPPAFNLETEKSPSAAVRRRGVELFLAARHSHS